MKLIKKLNKILIDLITNNINIRFYNYNIIIIFF